MMYPENFQDGLDKMISGLPVEERSVAGMAQNAFRKGDYYTAIAFCHRILQTNVGSAFAHTMLANCYLALGETFQALAEAELAIMLAPGDPYSLLVRGRANFLLGRIESSINDFLMARVILPNDVVVLSCTCAAYYFLDDIDNAIQYADEAIHMNPQDSNAWYIKGLSSIKRGEYTEALNDFDKSIGIAGRATHFLLGRVQANLCLGDYNSALADADEAIRLEPDNASAWSIRAEVCFGKSEFAAANHCFTRSIELNSSDISMYARRSAVYYKMGDSHRALIDAEYCITNAPSYGPGWEARAWASFLMEMYSRAIPDFTEAIRIGANSASSYSGRGASFYFVGDFEKAVADSSEAIRIDATYEYAWNIRAWARAGTESHEMAIADFGEAIRLDASNANSFCGRAEAYFAIGDYDRSWSDCQNAIGLNPAYSRVLALQGQILYVRGDYAGVIAKCDEAIRHVVDYGYSYIVRANAHRRLGRIENAMADYDKAVSLNPLDSYAYLSRGLANKQGGCIDQAMSDYNEAIRLRPNWTAALSKRAIACILTGNLNKALSDYTEIIRLRPHNPEGYNDRAKVYQILGDDSRASEDLRKASELLS